MILAFLNVLIYVRKERYICHEWGGYMKKSNQNAKKKIPIKLIQTIEYFMFISTFMLSKKIVVKIDIIAHCTYIHYTRSHTTYIQLKKKKKKKKKTLISVLISEENYLHEKK